VKRSPAYREKASAIWSAESRTSLKSKSDRQGRPSTGLASVGSRSAPAPSAGTRSTRGRDELVSGDVGSAPVHHDRGDLVPRHQPLDALQPQGQAIGSDVDPKRPQHVDRHRRARQRCDGADHNQDDCPRPSQPHGPEQQREPDGQGDRPSSQYRFLRSSTTPPRSTESGDGDAVVESIAATGQDDVCGLDGSVVGGVVRALDVQHPGTGRRQP
jgi:hypothetical protein